MDPVNDHKSSVITPDRKDLKGVIDKALQDGRILTLQTYYLSDYGQEVLNLILKSILTKYDRMDLHDVLYTATKELVMNGTKANLKRIIFCELALQKDSPVEYSDAMQEFKDNLTAEKVKSYKEKFMEKKYHVSTTFYYNDDAINIKVKNNFPLFDEEENRIREKFHKAEDFSSLLDFYMKHGDETEGAGLGLTMVGILLAESGIDRHCFTIATNKYNETAAKLEIPLSTDYIPKRKRFEAELSESGLGRDEFRKLKEKSAV